jgi:hypothetical protein
MKTRRLEPIPKAIASSRRISPDSAANLTDDSIIYWRIRQWLLRTYDSATTPANACSRA